MQEHCQIHSAQRINASLLFLLMCEIPWEAPGRGQQGQTAEQC